MLETPGAICDVQRTESGEDSERKYTKARWWPNPCASGIFPWKLSSLHRKKNAAIEKSEIRKGSPRVTRINPQGWDLVQASDISPLYITLYYVLCIRRIYDLLSINDHNLRCSRLCGALGTYNPSTIHEHDPRWVPISAFFAVLSAPLPMNLPKRRTRIKTYALVIYN